MAVKVNGTTVIDDSRNVCAVSVCACCIESSSTVTIPSGNTASRPTGGTGELFFDTDEGKLVAHNGTEWAVAGGSGGGVPNALNTSTDEPWGFINWLTNPNFLRQCFYTPHQCHAEVPFLNPNQPHSCCCCVCANYNGCSIYTISNVNTTEICTNTGLRICGGVLETGATGYNARTTFYSGSRILENVVGCHCCNCCWTGMHVWCDGSVAFKDRHFCSKKAAHDSLCTFCKCLVNYPKTFYISATGGTVLQNLTPYQGLFCACTTSGQSAWGRDDFFFRSHINQSIKGVSPFSPFKLCYYGYCDSCFFNVETQFSVTPETYLTGNEQVFDFAIEYHKCSGALRPTHPFARTTYGESCLKWKSGSNSMVSFDQSCFYPFSNLYFVSRRTDLWGGGLPRFPDHYVDQIYCCVSNNSVIDCSASGISRKTISFTCCPMFIAKRCSYAYCTANANFISDQVEKCNQNTFYSKDGTTIFSLVCAESCSGLSSCCFQSTGCTFGVSKSLILNTIDRVNATKCTRIMVTPTCMHPAACTAGCTYGTSNMPCLRNTCFYLPDTFECYGNSTNCVKNSKDEYHTCKHVVNGLPFGAGCWSYNLNKYYMIGQKCIYQNSRPACDGMVMVFDGDTCSIACGVNFGGLFGQNNDTGALKGSIFKLFSTPPACLISTICCNADMCRLIGGTITGDWCTYVCGITGDPNESLISHCLGFHLSNQKGSLFNCTGCGFMVQVGTAGNMGFSHTWVNPYNDHLVMLRAISSCIQLCCGPSTSSPCSIGWIGFICYDLTNCCVSEVATVWPGRTEATKKWFDGAHTAGGVDCYYWNSNHLRMGACTCCTGVQKLALANIVPYGDYTSYLASNSTDSGGVVLNFQGNAWAPNLKAGSCVCMEASCYFGSSGTAGTLLRNSTCCALCLSMGNSVYRIPHSKPMTCFFQSDPFLAQVLTYVANPLEHFNLTSPSAACLSCYAKCNICSEIITTLPPLCGCSTETNCPCGAVIPCASRLLEIFTDQCSICYCGYYGVCCRKICDFVCCHFNHCLRTSQDACFQPAMLTGINGKHLGNEDASNMNFDKFRIVSNNYSYIGDPRIETQLDGKTAWALKPGEDMFCRTIRWYTCLTGCPC